MKKDKSKRFLIFALLFLLLSIIFFFITKEKQIQTISHDMTIEVGLKPRFHLSPELNFGTTPPGGISKKQMNITNPYRHKINLRIKSEGNITDFINVNYTEKIQAGETAQIEVIAKIPPNTSFGNYSGTLILEFYRRVI